VVPGCIGAEGEGIDGGDMGDEVEGGDVEGVEGGAVCRDGACPVRTDGVNWSFNFCR